MKKRIPFPPLPTDSPERRALVNAFGWWSQAAKSHAGATFPAKVASVLAALHAAAGAPDENAGILRELAKVAARHLKHTTDIVSPDDLVARGQGSVLAHLEQSAPRAEVLDRVAHVLITTAGLVFTHGIDVRVPTAVGVLLDGSVRIPRAGDPDANKADEVFGVWARSRAFTPKALAILLRRILRAHGLSAAAMSSVMKDYTPSAEVLEALRWLEVGTHAIGPQPFDHIQTDKANKQIAGWMEWRTGSDIEAKKLKRDNERVGKSHKENRSCSKCDAPFIHTAGHHRGRPPTRCPACRTK